MYTFIQFITGACFIFLLVLLILQIIFITKLFFAGFPLPKRSLSTLMLMVLFILVLLLL